MTDSYNPNIEVRTIEIFPTAFQAEYFNKCFGVKRYIWNLCIDRFIIGNKDFDENGFKKELNRMILKDKYKWLNDVNSMVRQECLKDFKLALKKYSNSQRKLELRGLINPNHYRPSKKDEVQSFRYNNKGNPIKYISKYYFYLTTTICLKRFKIKTGESIKFLNSKNIRFAQITIKRDKFNRYFAIISFERINRKKYTKHQYSTVGIDMGIKHPLTIAYLNSDNDYEYDVYDLPKSIYTLQHRIEYESSKLTKRQIGSHNYLKHKKRIDKLYTRLVNIRKEFVFQTVNSLCKTFKNIIIEDFVYDYRKAGLKCNKTMTNIGKYRFIIHLIHKSNKMNNKVTFIPKGTPTTQTCCMCGHRYTGANKLTLKHRTYKCSECGLELDRDVNSAINILNYKESSS